jgi:glucokinase
MATLLAGDIGGTKTLLSLHTAGGSHPELLVEDRYVSADWPDLAPMLNHFLREGAAKAYPKPQVACMAVAGPVQAGRARLTNLPWVLDQTELALACDLQRLELVNDFAVLIYGLPHLQASQLAPVRAGEAVASAPLLVLGAGTGLGVAFGIPTAGGLAAVASEAAHAEFAPRTAAEWELREWLRHDLKLERVSIERVVSGTGLGHLARWLLAQRHPDGDHPLSGEARRWQQALAAGRSDADLPAAVAAAAAAAAEPLACEALDLWLSAYGSVSGDLALACLSRGGIWLAGGTAAKLLAGLRSSTFLQAFQAKGRLESSLAGMPIWAITDAAVGSFSAACRARSLLG